MVGDAPASSVTFARKFRRVRTLALSPTVFVSIHRQSESGVEKSRSLVDPAVDGYCALPLPKDFDLKAVLGAIDSEKDVDGFHLYNVGGLVVGDTVFPPSTPYGVMLLLDSAGIEVAGRNAVVIGASNVVGKPMALMLMQREERYQYVMQKHETWLNSPFWPIF